MKIINSIAEMQSLAINKSKDGAKIALVPTMGFLHEGHLSLIRKARALSDLLVVSIFVNPIQFGAGEDLESYPHNIQKDNALCEKEGVDVVFYPSKDNMYPDNYSTYIEEINLSTGLCGASRPGHFKGVTTIVAKLFNIVRPDITVFGQKDAQQLRVIEQMINNLNFPVKLISVPIVRESDGLAMSSRNSYLSPNERKTATCLFKTLCAAKEIYMKGERSSNIIKRVIKDLTENGNNKKEISIQIDYIDIVDYKTLKPVKHIKAKTLIALAVKIGTTRLIDNIIIEDV